MLLGLSMKAIKQVILFLIIGFVIGFLFFGKESITSLFSSNSTKDINYVNSGLTNHDQSLANLNDSISSSRNNAITRAIEKTYPAIVSLSVKSVQYRKPRSLFDYYMNGGYRKYVVPSVGSGFIISNDGYLVTNQHVIDKAKEIIVTLPNGERYEASKIGEDVQTDIALVKINGNKKDFPFVKFGNSESLKIGEWAIAIGNPFGLNELNNSPTVTLGIISALKRDFGHISGETKVYRDMIQTDAAINSGNSGGPLINALGDVVGMNTFIYTGSNGGSGSVGIGFSIPSNRIMQMIDILRDGDIDRNVFTGIYNMRTVNKQIAAYLGLSVKEGVIVIQIYRNSPVEKAGMEPGDIIVQVNDKKIKSAEDLREAILYSGLKVGDIIRIKVLREDKEMVFHVKLEKEK